MAYSPFLSPLANSQAGQLAILHLRRDQSFPTILLSENAPANEKGYAEGVVTNTRFGSFPHSTLVDVPWGSQVRASKVDTGSRGRQPRDSPQTGSKRKADDSVMAEEANASLDTLINGEKPSESKQAVPASSGFIHVLPPTPENWTTSLPHRTQVVYTPDYSYILHRIRARPGSVLIEAGSGSGSFTHAAARAVFSGYTDSTQELPNSVKSKNETITSYKRSKCGHVYSFEFHSERHGKLLKEMVDHDLSDVVTATHRDVYSHGFLLPSQTENGPEYSPSANVIFLDLPAPWQALPHLARQPSSGALSPLDPEETVQICTFSPCIEQAQKTVSSLRQHGWLEIDMVEVSQKRIDIRREHTGLQYEGMKSVNAVASDVDQAVAKLREVEKRIHEYHHGPQEVEGTSKTKTPSTNIGHSNGDTKPDGKTLWKNGRLVHRTEPDLKTHTSYLIFALLPREWTEDDERDARKRFVIDISATKPARSRRQLRKETKVKRSAERPSMTGEIDQEIEGTTEPFVGGNVER